MDSFLKISVKRCSCTDQYRIKTWSGKFIKGYCGPWSGTKFGNYCYLSGWLEGDECPGAKRSGKGDVYFTKDKEICPGLY